MPLVASLLLVVRPGAPGSEHCSKVNPLSGGAWQELILLPAEAKFSMEADSDGPKIEPLGALRSRVPKRDASC